MSDLKQILALVGDSPRSDAVLALATRLARRHGAAVQALHAAEPFGTGAYLTPEAAGVAVQWWAEEDERRRTAAAGRVAQAAHAFGAEIPFTPLAVNAVQAALPRAHAADLVVLAQRDPQGGDGTPAGFAEKLLVTAGRPLLFLPYVNTLPLEADGAPRLGQRALVAWAPRRESVRALHDALPLLRDAGEVRLMHFLRPGEADDGSAALAAGWLGRHGVRATVHLQHAASPSLQERLLHSGSIDVPIAEALLSLAADVDADLLVMGGYGHPRAWELVLGGVTRTMLASMTVPVLMSN